MSSRNFLGDTKEERILEAIGSINSRLDSLSVSNRCLQNTVDGMQRSVTNIEKKLAGHAAIFGILGSLAVAFVHKITKMLGA